MIVTVRITKSFKTAVKPLLRKYPTLRNDLLKLEEALIEDPRQGTSLGKNIYKIRLKISSKAKGKSGGARVISLIESVLIGAVAVENDTITVNLLTIYDKADTASITDKELKELIKTFHESR